MMDKIPTPLHIAILGDLHGHFILAYRLLSRWQRESGKQVDLILQVGDLGAFPPPFRLDKATRRFSEKDPEELGFAKFYERTEEADNIIGPNSTLGIDADFVFIKGNHEDFLFLQEMVDPSCSIVSVDYYQRIFYLRSGTLFHYQKGEHKIRLIALGGISDRTKPGRDPVSEFYTQNEIRHLQSEGNKIDIFLSHEPPYDTAGCVHPKYEQSGSLAVRDFIASFAPRYHFCGHYHEPGQALEVPGNTKSYILHAVNFFKRNRLNPGCIGMLSWLGDQAVDFEILDEPWFQEYTRDNYRYL